MIFQLTGTNAMNSLLNQITSDGRHQQQYFSPYGGIFTVLAHKPGFNGERNDPLSGVTHLGNGYRAYNPILMRFHTPDGYSPFGNGGLNCYVYCEGEPINNSDPSGHQVERKWISRSIGALRSTLSSLRDVCKIGYSMGDRRYNLRHSGKENSKVSLIGLRSADMGMEERITQSLLNNFDIKDDFVAVRVQDDSFTDFKRKQIQGHQGTVARVRDWYNPIMRDHGPVGRLRASSDIAKSENRNALNVMLMSKDDFESNIIGGAGSLQANYGGGSSKSWVVSTLQNLIHEGGKFYPDESSSVRVGNTGYPFIVTLPSTSMLDVDIYPVR